MAAFCYARRKVNAWVTDRAQEVAEAARLFRRVVELGKDDAATLYRAGYALAYVVGELNAGVGFIDRALVLNPNLAQAWAYSGWARVFLGEHESAIEHEARAMRLSPLDPFFYVMLSATSNAHMLLGRHDEAVSWAERAFREQPNFLPPLRVLAASNALAGRLEEARNAMARLRELDPEDRVSKLKDRLPFLRPADAATWADGLRKAGMPE
jgi:tetratricopeptide (TPR) repeat protein